MKKRVIGLTLLLVTALTISASATAEEASDDLLVVQLTQETLGTITEEAPLILSSEEATIAIPQSTAEAFMQGEDDVVITLSHGDYADLTADQQNQMGYNTFYVLSIAQAGSELLGWGGAPISITLPYSDDVAAGEVLAWMLGESLNHSYGLTANYQQETQSVTLETNETGYIGMATNPFSDVTADIDYYIPILWASSEGIVSGMGDGLYSPDTTCTRAMICAVLWRMSGEPDWGICYPYADVDADLWYTDPVYWCTVNGIVAGYDDETFRPNQAITREELVAVLYRYAQHLEMDVSVGENTNILSYTDVFDISDYAISAFQWGCGADVVVGDDSALYPQREATRSELVAMLMRLRQ